MNFYIVDDDEVHRSMLAQIIEDEDLGDIIGEAEDGFMLEKNLMILKYVDILFIDLLMPVCDGLETIRRLKGEFLGKIIMISQVESKELIGEAYSLGVEYYISKPINRIEVLSVIRKVMERIQLEKSISEIQKSLNTVFNLQQPKQETANVLKKTSIVTAGEFLLSELGILGENGSKDLLDILQYLDQYEQHHTFEQFPPLKEIFVQITLRKLGTPAAQIDIQREVKASEQRVRRTIYQSLNHLASLGLSDFSNAKFENYASKFFDFTIVRKKMTELQKNPKATASSTRINTKKFIQVLYFESKRLIQED
ncbi:response regulator [Bacillus sp. ISL-40]|uniref:response regulator n=1 Tax=unclassified Bacillus (in: firmicutes) TaxID=185979 RepID=UPI001BE783BA|nr:MULTISPECIES: response regulator [unclassified Bacillus (in: firmicutes)]MBT2697550.1 response regulator [Bacillus sp. ISL-40]MBT2720900.1 response regulator [Bacillus sp. ISL-46]MBT2729849.1 response regulator [Bacillus sp. ISL-75]MBT2742254.1 response regulator [Bacillus sp. ISL-77]